MSRWTLERDEFGRPWVVRHRHAGEMVSGYIATGPDGGKYAKCPSCGDQQPLEAIDEADEPDETAG